MTPEQAHKLANLAIALGTLWVIVAALWVILLATLIDRFVKLFK